MASRTLWAAELAAPLARAGLSLYALLDNLTDRRASDLYGYPLPGRTLRAGLIWAARPGTDVPEASAGPAPDAP